MFVVSKRHGDTRTARENAVHLVFGFSAMPRSRVAAGESIRSQTGAEYVSAGEKSDVISNEFAIFSHNERIFNQCGNDVRLLTFKFRPGSMAPYFTDVYTGCLAGCDTQFLDMLEIRRSSGTSGGARTQSKPEEWLKCIPTVLCELVTTRLSLCRFQRYFFGLFERIFELWRRGRRKRWW